MKKKLFQSTSPAWGMTAGLRTAVQIVAISIHIPRVGDDDIQSDAVAATVAISIHIPRVGDDI